MSFLFRGKRRGLLSALIACALTAAMLGAIAQSASAFVPCPSGETPAGGIEEWETDFPREYDRAGGVTLCEASGGFLGTDTMGHLEMVDLNDGAKIRLQAEVAPKREWNEEDRYIKRTAEEWFYWLKGLDPNEREWDPGDWSFVEPSSDRLFSITNASFQTNTTNGVPTEVPFPLMSGFGGALGVTYGRTRGFDYESPKEGLMFGSPYSPATQDVAIETFPTHYEYEDYWNYLAHVGGDIFEYDTWDATVAFTPEVVVGEAEEEYKNRRNYVGIYDHVVYIWTSDNDYTNEETIRIMEEIQPGMEMIQLDGGGSAQFYTRENGEMDSSIPLDDRQVASVLAVYRAAE